MTLDGEAIHEHPAPWFVTREGVSGELAITVTSDCARDSDARSASYTHCVAWASIEPMSAADFSLTGATLWTLPPTRSGHSRNTSAQTGDTSRIGPACLRAAFRPLTRSRSLCRTPMLRLVGRGLVLNAKIIPSIGAPVSIMSRESAASLRRFRLQRAVAVRRSCRLEGPGRRLDVAGGPD